MLLCAGDARLTWGISAFTAECAERASETAASIPSRELPSVAQLSFNSPGSQPKRRKVSCRLGCCYCIPGGGANKVPRIVISDSRRACLIRRLNAGFDAAVRQRKRNRGNFDFGDAGVLRNPNFSCCGR